MVSAMRKRIHRKTTLTQADYQQLYKQGKISLEKCYEKYKELLVNELNPILERYAFTEQWAKFIALVELNKELVPAALKLYSRMPQYLQYEFLMTCYQAWGDSIPDLVEAMKCLPANYQLSE